VELYFDNALQGFQKNKKELVDFQNQKLSETDSRSKIIDPLLIKILQWKEESITREPHINAGYMDYYCKSEFNCFVLEAKSTKIDFKVPKSNKIQYSTSKKIQKTESLLYDAVEQARSYAQQKGTSFFVVSNGLHLTIAKTYVSGDEKYNLMILDGEECIEGNLHIILNLLSPYQDGSKFFLKCIESGFELRNPPQFNKTLLQTALYNSKSYKGTNVLAQPLAEILSDYFEDISVDVNILDKVYCNTSNLDNYSKEMRTFLKGRVSMLGLPVEEVYQIETSDESSTILGNDMTMKRQNKKKGHLFVIFGNLGAGKTTFLSRYYNHILNEMQRKKFLWILIDFQSFYGNLLDVDEFITNQIEESIYKVEENFTKFEVLKEIYSVEIERMVGGAWAPYSNNSEELNKKIGDFIEQKQYNRKEHIEKSLRHLIAKYNYEICMVFDNLDQHSNSLQEQVSLYAVTRTKELGILAIVSIRDETYWSLRRKPPLNAYGNITSYQVVSPSMEQVLLKRINYVLSIMGDKKITFDSNRDRQLNAVIEMDYNSLFSLFKDTIQTEEIKEIVNNLSSGDIRKGLKIFKNIITSGHIDLNNIISYPYMSPENKKTIPYDKIIKSVGLADQVFYDSNKSEIFNIFRTNSIDGFYSHLINYRILEILENNIGGRPVLNGPQGFISIKELLSQLKIYCNSENSLRELLIPFLERFLIESDIGARRLEDENYYKDINFVRITPSGLYHKNTLIFNHQYLEMVSMDTPIHDETTYKLLMQENKKILEVAYNKRWQHKFNAVAIFSDYLKKKEEEEMAWIKSNGIMHFGLVIPTLINEYASKKVDIVRILKTRNLI